MRMFQLSTECDIWTHLSQSWKFLPTIGRNVGTPVYQWGEIALGKGSL